MKKTIRLTESELINLIDRLIKENINEELFVNKEGIGMNPKENMAKTVAVDDFVSNNVREIIEMNKKLKLDFSKLSDELYAMVDNNQVSDYKLECERKQGLYLCKYSGKIYLNDIKELENIKKVQSYN